MLTPTDGAVRTFPSPVIYQPVRMTWRYFMKLILLILLLFFIWIRLYNHHQSEVNALSSFNNHN